MRPGRGGNILADWRLFSSQFRYIITCMYDSGHLYHIDFSDSQLPEEELTIFLARKRIEQAADVLKEKRHWEKARSFRFVGGM